MQLKEKQEDLVVKEKEYQTLKRDVDALDMAGTQKKLTALKLEEDKLAKQQMFLKGQIKEMNVYISIHYIMSIFL